MCTVKKKMEILPRYLYMANHSLSHIKSSKISLGKSRLSPAYKTDNDVLLCRANSKHFNIAKAREVENGHTTNNLKRLMTFQATTPVIRHPRPSTELFQTRLFEPGRAYGHEIHSSGFTLTSRERTSGETPASRYREGLLLSHSLSHAL